MTLLWFAQYFNLTLKYTPTITYSKDQEFVNNTIEGDLKYFPINFETNYIPYMKKKQLDRVLQYDNVGVRKAREIAYSYKVILSRFLADTFSNSIHVIALETNDIDERIL